MKGKDPGFQKRTYWCIGLLLLLSGMLSLPQDGRAEKKHPYLLAVVPSAPPVAIHATWVPFVDALSRATGLTFKLKVYEKMSDFETEIEEGVPDIIFASPTQTVLARKTQGYIPLVKSSKQLAGVLFVRKDSPYRSVRDLEGKEIAFVGQRNL